MSEKKVEVTRTEKKTEVTEQTRTGPQDQPENRPDSANPGETVVKKTETIRGG